MHCYRTNAQMITSWEPIFSFSFCYRTYLAVETVYHHVGKLKLHIFMTKVILKILIYGLILFVRDHLFAKVLSVNDGITDGLPDLE